MPFWRGIRVLLLPVLLLMACMAGADDGDRVDEVLGAPNFTAEERAWIARHPVLRVGVIADLQPIEYMEDGHLHGLSAEYLAHVSRKTGLRLDYKPYGRKDATRFDDLLAGKLDLLSAVRINGPEGIDRRLVHTSAYLDTTAVVVTRKKQVLISKIGDLDGMTVTLPNLTRYKDVISAKAPDARLVDGGAALTMLRQVATGEADAAVATEAYLLPFVNREFSDQLQVSGVLTEITTEMAMSLRTDQRVLHAIVQKALASMSADEVRTARASWLRHNASLHFTLFDITDHYPHEVGLVLLLVVLLAAIAFHTQRQRRRAEFKERAKAIFLAVMSHEIRSLMNAVLAAVELLRRTSLDRRQQHFARLVHNGSNTLLSLVTDLLDISKLEANREWIEYVPVNIATLVRDAVDLHLLRAREKHISLTWEGDANPPLLMLDEVRLGQILRNLVSNAIKFTETGGVAVSFRVSNGDAGPKARMPPQMQLHVVVTDTGIGITPQSQQTLFDPYVQAKDSHKRSGGTGLGMFICRELLKLMKGTISVSSETGKGTRIAFSLPAALATVASTASQPEAMQAMAEAPEAAHRVAPLAAGPLRTLRTLRVLVVEDTPINQAVLKDQLEGLGCTTVIASNAAEGVLRFEQGPHDIVLMDCDLPDQDGYALTARLRGVEQQAGWPRCPVIAISAFDDATHIERCFEAGMDGVLSKPIALGKLQDTLELWSGATLSFVAPLPAGKRTLDGPWIAQSLEHDLHALLEAAALGDIDAARRAAHRLHGATLGIGWSAVAQVAGALEQLLRDGTHWDALRTSTLQALVRSFRTTAFPAPPAAGVR
ncbi:ATP-binding protein [Variovorax sp. RCC_210]|uniref:ATP-binding protein n=1 Tax=Variovorax sp. RCC_210 TaxID=3239217 RepID=UPI00352675DD